MIHFHLHLAGDLLHDALALGLRLIGETSSEMFHVTVAWEENTANYALSFEVFYPEVAHINTTYIFLVKAGHVAMPNLKRWRNTCLDHLSRGRQTENFISSLTAIVFP